MFRKEKPKVSVCIPVFRTEKYLDSCLESVALQNFQGIEIVVVDDSGKNRENGCLSTEKIVKSFRKRHRMKKTGLKFIKHGENKGLLESRRSALYESSGEYIMFLDSDDTLPPGAVNSLYVNALESGSDIVHGKANAVLKKDGSEKRLREMKRKAGNVFLGVLSGRGVFDGFLVSGNHSGFLWGKIFRRSLCFSAFEMIPPCYCVLGEDFLTYFYMSFFAEKYTGIEKTVYNYSVDTGISSARKITDLNEWKKVCSTSSVFTVIFSSAEEKASGGDRDFYVGSEKRIALSSEESEKLREICRSYAANNLMQLEKTVSPCIYKEARDELCAWWGENMILDIEKAMEIMEEDEQ